MPGIVEWPGRLVPKVVDHYPAFTSDYFPTIASLIGTDLAKYNRTYDGVNLMPILSGAHTPMEPPGKGREQKMIFLLREQVALIDNQYKIYSDDKGQKFQLFDLQSDPGETIDLSVSEPDIKARMVAEWVTWERGID